MTPDSEDTVWHWEALLSKARQKSSPRTNKKAAFDSPARLKSLTTLQTMATRDKSMYLDPSNQAYADVFNSGEIGMLVDRPLGNGAGHVHERALRRADHAVVPRHRAAGTRPSRARTTG